MSESFYNYLVKDLLLDFFKKNPVARGCRYYMIIEDEENRKEFISALQRYAQEIEISNIYQGNNNRIQEEPYSTYVLTISEDKPSLIIGYDKTSTEDYLTTIRNSVGVRGNKYENYGALFILSDSVLSSLFTACKDLQAEGAPLNVAYVNDNIKLNAKNCLAKKLELDYLHKYLEKLSEDISDGLCNLFDFSTCMSVLKEKQLKGHFDELGFFSDAAIYDNGFKPSPKEIKDRVETNFKYFQRINAIMQDDGDDTKLASLEKILDEREAKSILKDKSWKTRDFQKILDSIERKAETANLEFNEERLVDESICQMVHTHKGNNRKKSCNYYILCDEEIDTPREVKLLFNKGINKKKKDEKKKDSKKDNDAYTIKGNCVNVKVKDKLIKFKIGVNDNHHDFFFQKISCRKSFFKTIENDFTINARGEIVVKVDEGVGVIRLGDGPEKVELPLNHTLPWNNDYSLEIPIDEDDDTIKFTINFNGKDVSFVFKISNKIVIPIGPDGTKEGVTYTGVNFNESPFGKISDGVCEYSVLVYWRKYLEWEQDFIDNSCHMIHFEMNELTKLSRPVYDKLDLPEKVSASLDALFYYFKKLNSVPSLVAIDDELEVLYDNYWKSVVKAINAIPTDRSLNKQEYNLTKLGIVEDWNRIYLSPFHPLLVAYMLEHHRMYDNKEDLSFASKLLSPFYLLPYLYYNDSPMRPYTDNQLSEVHNWLSYEGVNSKQQERTNDITTKMTWSKMTAFISYFPYLFQDKDCPIVISTIGIDDDTNVIKGVIEFIKRQYSTGVQKIEIHEYVNNLAFETFFEKLNRLDSIDSIIRELDRIGISIEAKSEYTSQEIIHQLFTRVSFYKHELKEENKHIDYCHIAFFQMDSGNSFIKPNTDESRMELSLGGLISVPSTLNKSDAYILGFGTKGLTKAEGFIYPMAIAMNNLYANEENEGSSVYRDHTCVAKRYKFNSSELLNSVYENANWVTFINPEVDIDFFYKQPDLYVVHYTDQYTINAKYDSITVTKHIKQYENMLKRPYEHFTLSDEYFLHFNKTMLSYFNCLNGSWMLNIVNKTEAQIREKMSIVATCIVMLQFMKRNKNIIWIPISLEEILRVTGSIGLPLKHIFTKKELGVKGQMSDDLLMIGLDVADSSNLKMYMYPVEVKFSKNSSMVDKGSAQVVQTFKQLKEHLCGELSFSKKIYRTFFASQFLNNAEKLNANGLLKGEEYAAIENCRYELLNLKYSIEQMLPVVEMGNAAVVSFFSHASHQLSTSIVDDVALCEIHFSEKECFRFVAEPSSRELDFMLNGEISIDEAAKSLISNSQLMSVDEYEDETEVEFTEDVDDVEVMNVEDELESLNVSDRKIISKDDINESSAIKIKIGTTPSGSKDIIFEPNNTRMVSHPNMAIIGTMGTGKTQLARSVIAQFSKESKHNVGGKPIGLLVFDYKGDYKDAEFLNSVHGECYRYKYPFNPLKLVITEDVDGMNLPAITADRISDSFAKAYGLGSVQQSNIKQIIIDTYNDFGITRNPETWNNIVPTMDDVINKYFENYNANDRAYALFDKLNDYTIFNPDNSGCVSLFEWLDGVKVIDLTLYPDDTKKVIVSLILDLFYAEMKQLGGSKSENGYREIRAMILVDEAHQFLKKDFNALRSIISEGRMFGVGMILSTQNVGDFKGSKEDYSQFILSWVIHHVNSITKSEIANIFGASDPYADNYMNFINKAGLFESICKLGGMVEGIRDLPYFELIKSDGRFVEEQP